MKKLFQGRFGIIATLVLCWGGVLAISQFFLLRYSIRLDESQSLWQTSHSWRGTLEIVGKDVHVPAYHLMLHGWQIFFGQSIEAARSMSMLFFLLSIPAMLALARLHLKRNWALLATVLYSFSPFMNWYANEARMYTLLILVAIMSQYFFTKIVQGKKGWLGYTLTAMVGIYCHYFFFFGLAAQGLFYLFNYKKFPKGTFKKYLLLGGIIAAEFTPWLLFFRSLGSGSSFSPKLPVPTSIDFFNAFSNFAFGFQTDYVNTILVSTWPILVVVSLLFVKRRQKIELPMAYMLAAAILPVALAFAVSVVIRPFFLSRYMVACLPPLIIFTLWLVSNYRTWLSRAVVILFLAILGLSSYLQISNPMTPVKENYQAVADRIKAEASPRDIVVLSTPFTVYPFEYVYKNGPTQVQTIPNWDRRSTTGIPPFEEGKLAEQVKAINEGHRYVYLLLSYDQGYEEQVYQYYVGNFKLVDKTEYSNDLTLYKFQISYNEPVPLSELPAKDKIQAQ